MSNITQDMKHPVAHRTDEELLLSGEDVPGPIYVFEAPVRAWHWIHALAIVILCVTGYFIGNPLPSMSGEASDHFLMGNLRLVHFIAAFVFTIGLIVRFYWAFVGNHYSKELFWARWYTPGWWARYIHEVKVYLFLTRKVAKNPGHNPLGQQAMWLTNVILAIFMICTGFALYSQGTGAGSWADTLFGWVFVLEPSSQAVRMFHYLGMWFFVVFIVIHLYMVTRAEFMSRQNGISVIINGWRTFKDDGPLGPQ